MNKPNHNSAKEITKQDLNDLEAIEVVEFIDGYTSDDLQHYLNF